MTNYVVEGVTAAVAVAGDPVADGEDPDIIDCSPLANPLPEAGDAPGTTGFTALELTC